MDHTEFRRRILPTWLVGVLAATCALIVMGFLSVGFFVSVGGLVIAWTVAFMAGTGAAAVVEPAHSGRNASVVAFYLIVLVAVYVLILPALAAQSLPAHAVGRVWTLRGPAVVPALSPASVRLPPRHGRSERPSLAVVEPRASRVTRRPASRAPRPLSSSPAVEAKHCSS